jgi:DNA-binding transcriptional MerR regulator
MRIGQLAAQTVVTIRYERRGFLKRQRRLSSGYRDYSPEGAAIVGFIKRPQKEEFEAKLKLRRELPVLWRVVFFLYRCAREH